MTDPGAPGGQTRSRRRDLLGFVTNAFATIAVQAIAILTLGPAEYGHFSLLYLEAAFGTTWMFSLVAEPWSRDSRHDVNEREGWAQYSRALNTVALAAGGLAVIVSLLMVHSILQAALAAVAVIATVVRLGARYHSVAEHNHRYVDIPDGLAAVSAVGLWLICHDLLDPLNAVLIAWAGSMLIAALASRPPALRRTHGFVHWVRSHSRSIRDLLLDSVLLDTSTFVIPMIWAPIIGLHKFGVVRALSSAAVPVRLLTAPLRPMIARAEQASSLPRRFKLMALGGALALGVVAYVGLLLVSSLIGRAGDSDNVLIALRPYAIGVALFIAANWITTLTYLVSRIQFPASWLRRFRFLQLALSIIAPVVGWLLADLTGIIYGSVIAEMILAVAYLVAADRLARLQRAGSDGDASESGAAAVSALPTEYDVAGSGDQDRP